MRSCGKSLGLLASLGILLSSASAQLPSPTEGGAPPPPKPGPPGAFLSGPPPCPPTEFPNVAPTPELPSAFELRKELPANGFSEKPEPCSPIRWQASADYLLLWFRAGTYPPLATVGNIADPFPGALNQPNTALITQTRDPGDSAAGRVNLTCWLVDPEILSLKARFFAMAERGVRHGVASDANGSPVLARPYLNAVTGREDADLRSFPGVFRGSLFDAVTTRLMGAELNLDRSSVSNHEGASLSVLAGVRWLRLDERYSNFDTTTDLGGGGTATTFSDNFAAHNQFLGGQLGVDFRYRFTRLSLGLTGKVAVGPNWQRITVNGQTIVTDLATGARVGDDQGLFAQPTNVGTHRSCRGAILSEVEGKLSFDITECLRFNVGYTFFYLSNTVRPGDQMNRIINIQTIQAPVAAPFLPAPPPFTQSSFSGQMLSLGFEILF